STAAIRLAIFRMYDRSTRTATCVFRQKVNAALAAKRRSGRSGRERPGSAARRAPITRPEYRCEMRIKKGSDERWLLLGATGLVGTHLRAALRERDVVMTSHRAQRPGTVAVDLTDRATTAKLIREARPDVIVVAAANAFVEECERDPVATRVINVDAVRHIAELAPKALLVVFSSEYVFDGRAGRYAEDDAVAPINEYGRQKVAVEAIARERSDHPVCRVSGVYGWSSARTSFVCQLIERLSAGQPMRVRSDQLITPTPAADLAGVIVELVDRSARGIFHAAGPEILPRPEFA